MRWWCGRKSCKTNSPKRASPPKSPVRQHVGYTKIFAKPVFLNKLTKKWKTDTNAVVKYVVNKKHPNKSGYYTNTEFKILASTPSWG